MFGNHPLPNIAPSFLCFLPPPTHNPLPPPALLPLTNAHTGQARACSLLMPMPTHARPLHCITGTHTTHHPSASPHVCPSPHQGMWANDMPHHRSEPPPWLPTATLNCHITNERACVCHITAANDPHPPPHHPKPARTPHHGWRRPPHAVLQPLTSMPATPPLPMTLTSHSGPRNRWVGARRSEEDREREWWG